MAEDDPEVKQYLDKLHAHKYFPYFEVARNAALQAGKHIRDGISKAKNISSKTNSADIVTESDKKCEEIIISRIRATYPNAKFIAEESHATGDEYHFTDDLTFLIDPIDGTTNFAHTFPYCCVSIGMALKKKVVVGVVYNPISDELFTAVEGLGARLNRKKISVSTQNDFRQALLVCEFGYDRSEEGVKDALKKIENLLRANIQGIRALGSCALNLCYIACGRLDLYYEGLDKKQGPKPWDFAAGTLILAEAGGFVSDLNLSPHSMLEGRILAANNAALAKTLSEILLKK